MQFVFSPFIYESSVLGCVQFAVIDLFTDRLLASIIVAHNLWPLRCCPVTCGALVQLFSLVRVVRAFLIEEQKIVKKVLLEKQKKKKA